MKKFIFILLVAFVTIISTGSCYWYETVTDYEYESAESYYNSKYKGYTKTQIVNDYGAPDRVVPIEGQSVILVYETYAVRKPFDPWGLGIGSSTVERTSYVEFYIGNDSKCYKVKTNKLKAIPYQKTIKKSIFDC